MTSLCQRVGMRPRLANCSSTRAINPGSGATSIEKQTIGSRDGRAELASHANEVLDGNRSELNITHATFGNVETSGFVGAPRGDPAGNSRARNSPKACFHARTLSRDSEGVNRLSQMARSCRG